jgi:hypothetical protein
LPHVEKGNIRLIGATTENPSFEINSALLSRCRVYVLQPLTEEQIVLLLRRAIADQERGLGEMNLTASDDVLKLIASYTSGDARSAYNVLEVAAGLAHKNSEGAREITDEIVRDALQKRILLYDKSGESTTTSSQRCTSRCATAILTRPCIGWDACSKPERIHFTLRAASSVWRSKTLGSPIPTRCRSAWPPAMP